MPIRNTYWILGLCWLSINCSSSPVEGEIIDGYQYHYYKSGKIRVKAQVDENVKREGATTYYYESGIIEQTAYYVRDTLFGEMKSYFPSGQLRNFTYYEFGRPHGMSIEYYENGIVAGRGMYKDGIRDGLFETFYESGVRKKLCDYHNGSMIAYENFDSVGRLTQRSVQVLVDVVDLEQVYVSQPIDINVYTNYQSYSSDSCKAFLYIINEKDSVVIPCSFEGQKFHSRFVPSDTGKLLIKAEITDWVNTAQGIIFRSSDYAEIEVK